MKSWLLLLSLASVSSHAAIVFRETCNVLKSPSPTAAASCQKEPGVTLLAIKKASNNYYFVDTGDCRGYVIAACLKKQSPNSATNDARSSRYIPQKLTANTAPRDRDLASSRESVLKLGPTGMIGGIWARPTSAGGSSNGLGFSFGLAATLPIAKKFRATLIPTFAIYNLTRTLDGTGSIADPNPLSFTQKVSFFGGSLLAGYQVAGETSMQGASEQWFIDVGFEFLKAMSASQSDSLGNSLDFETDDKLALVLLGPSGDFSLTDSINVNAFLQFFYNVGAQGGSQMLGGRLQVALQFGI